MNDSVLDKFLTTPLRERLQADKFDEGDTSDDLGAFGCLRGARDRALMLELRKKTGNIRAIGYAWLQRIEFDPSKGITLLGAGEKIQLIGRHLNAEVLPNLRLFQSLVRQRVLWVQEADEATLLQAKDHQTLIERIEW
jgi:hypothetical protein